jgi:hypothetical protein
MRTLYLSTRVVCLVVLLSILSTPLIAAPQHAAASVQAGLARAFEPPDRDLPLLQRLIKKVRKLIGATDGDEMSVPKP